VSAEGDAGEDLAAANDCEDDDDASDVDDVADVDDVDDDEAAKEDDVDDDEAVKGDDVDDDEVAKEDDRAIHDANNDAAAGDDDDDPAEKSRIRLGDGWISRAFSSSVRATWSLHRSCMVIAPRSGLVEVEAGVQVLDVAEAGVPWSGDRSVF